MFRIWTKLNKKHCFSMSKHTTRCSCNGFHLELGNWMIYYIKCVLKLLESNLSKKYLEFCFNLFCLIKKIILLLFLSWKQLVQYGLKLLRSGIKWNLCSPYCLIVTVDKINPYFLRDLLFLIFIRYC
jgi:hypothetical protein